MDWAKEGSLGEANDASRLPFSSWSHQWRVLTRVQYSSVQFCTGSYSSPLIWTNFLQTRGPGHQAYFFPIRRTGKQQDHADFYGVGNFDFVPFRRLAFRKPGMLD